VWGIPAEASVVPPLTLLLAVVAVLAALLVVVLAPAVFLREQRVWAALLVLDWLLLPVVESACVKGCEALISWQWAVSGLQSHIASRVLRQVGGC